MDNSQRTSIPLVGFDPSQPVGELEIHDSGPMMNLYIHGAGNGVTVLAQLRPACARELAAALVKHAELIEGRAA